MNKSIQEAPTRQYHVTTEPAQEESLPGVVSDFPINPVAGQLHRAKLELDYVFIGAAWVLAVTDKQRMVNL